MYSNHLSLQLLIRCSVPCFLHSRQPAREVYCGETCLIFVLHFNPHSIQYCTFVPNRPTSQVSRHQTAESVVSLIVVHFIPLFGPCSTFSSSRSNGQGSIQWKLTYLIFVYTSTPLSIQYSTFIPSRSTIQVSRHQTAESDISYKCFSLQLPTRSSVPHLPLPSTSRDRGQVTLTYSPSLEHDAGREQPCPLLSALNGLKRRFTGSYND